jgi:50S ribosomal protein L16 3-hydroxylase
MKGNPLGDLEPAQFLRRHWQKKPLIARGALSEIVGKFRAPEVMSLAYRDDVESRLVTRSSGRWHVRNGPFRPKELARLPRSNWTLLVQGVELHLPCGRELMDRFAFVPYARQDDLMVSIAPEGGGVGPHFDSYDVFLVQAHGRRRWRLSAQSDLRLVENAPLKILRRFSPTEQLTVDPGDVLYLPPRYAHDGEALGDCLTCSVGFRAPGRQELCVEFLQWLQDEIALDGRYADPDLAQQRHPAVISAKMIERVGAMLGALHWRRSDVERFLGCYLTEPKMLTLFARPAPALGPGQFLMSARRRGLRLALKTRMLVDGRRVYINGECYPMKGPERTLLLELADRRVLQPQTGAADSVVRQLHLWYKSGYVELG